MTKTNIVCILFKDIGSATYRIFAPAKTPPALVARLHQEIAGALKKPDIKDRSSGAGMETVVGSPEQLAAFMRGEIAIMGKVNRDVGIHDQ